MEIFGTAEKGLSNATESSATGPILPDGNDAMDVTHQILPAANEIFTQRYFLLPIYTIATLFENSDLFGLAMVPEACIGDLSIKRC